MNRIPLEYSRPAPKRPYSMAAIFSLSASVISGPAGAQSNWFPSLPEPLWLTMRLLPVGTAIIFGVWTFWRLEPMRRRYRGLWLVELGLLIDLFWLLSLLSAPI